MDTELKLAMLFSADIDWLNGETSVNLIVCVAISPHCDPKTEDHTGR